MPIIDDNDKGDRVGPPKSQSINELLIVVQTRVDLLVLLLGDSARRVIGGGGHDRRADAPALALVIGKPVVTLREGRAVSRGGGGVGVSLPIPLPVEFSP